MTYLISLLACLTDVPNSWCPKPNLPCSSPALPYPQSSSAELTTSPCSVLKPQNHAWLLKSHAQSFNKSCRFNLQNIHKPWQWCACLLLPAWPRHHHRHRFSRVLLQKFPDGSSRCYSFSVCQLKKKLKYTAKWFISTHTYGSSKVAAAVKNPPANAGDAAAVFNPWVRKIPGGGNSNPLQYSCLENSMDKGGWWGHSPWGHKELIMTKHAWHTCIY